MKFAQVYGIKVQYQCALDIKGVFQSVKAPKIHEVTRSYTSEQVNSFILSHLMDLYKYAGVKEKPSMEQLIQLCEIIKIKYSYLNVAELLLFFYKMKAGDYGKFYGSVDPMAILENLDKFIKFRAEMLDLYERERKAIEMDKKRDEWAEKAVPMPENLQFVKRLFADHGIKLLEL